jgi:hypothetical protein
MAWLWTRWAKFRGYQVLAPLKDQLGREITCRCCEFFSEGQCNKCGCLIMAKTMLATEKCPVGKWGRLWVKKGRAQ